MKAGLEMNLPVDQSLAVVAAALPEVLRMPVAEQLVAAPPEPEPQLVALPELPEPQLAVELPAAAPRALLPGIVPVAAAGRLVAHVRFDIRDRDARLLPQSLPARGGSLHLSCGPLQPVCGRLPRRCAPVSGKPVPVSLCIPDIAAANAVRRRLPAAGWGRSPAEHALGLPQLHAPLFLLLIPRAAPPQRDAPPLACSRFGYSAVSMPFPVPAAALPLRFFVSSALFPARAFVYQRSGVAPSGHIPD